MRIVIATIVFTGALSSGTEPDWPRFRGPNGSGVSDATGLPVEFGPKQNVLWKADLPPGHSSPVWTGDRIFVTGFSGDRLYTICLDRHTGVERWRQELPRPKPARYHGRNSPASPTPVSDGWDLYVFFQEAGLLSYSFEGKLRWRLDLEVPQPGHGMGASPILAGGLVIMSYDPGNGRSFLLGVEKDTGRIRWRTERRGTGFIGGYSTPVLFGEDEVVVPGSLRWAAYSVATGEKTWEIDGLPSQPKSSPIVVGDRLFGNIPAFAEGAPDEYFSFAKALSMDKNQDGKISLEEASLPEARPWFVWADKNSDGLVTEDEWNTQTAAVRGRNTIFALRKSGRGDSTVNILWNREAPVPLVATPIHYRGVLYLIRGGGVLTSIDPDTGAALKTARLNGAIDQYFASPVAAEGKLYLTSQAGHVVVVKAEARWEVLAVNDLGDDCYATPALAEGRLHIRTRSALFCFSVRTAPVAARAGESNAARRALNTSSRLAVKVIF